MRQIDTELSTRIYNALSTPVTKQAVANNLLVPYPTVRTVINRLQSMGLVTTQGTQKTGGRGRPSFLYVQVPRENVNLNNE